MKNTPLRLYFIDVIRAFAICMMLQGHFIDGLLGNVYRDTNTIFFSIWLYFRGITAPVFFCVSGFIFMYLLAKESAPDKIGWKHVRVRKGIKRGITLIITAYLLRTNLYNLFSNFVDMNVRKVDVLHCIGLSLLFLISIYLFSYQRKRHVLPSILFFFWFVIFLFEPVYKHLSYDYLPIELANYFTRSNGSVFTIFPWFGYTAFGAFMGVLFNLYKESPKIYLYAIALSLIIGLGLSLGSTSFFLKIHHLTGLKLAYWHSQKGYVFERLGNVLLVFTFFMLLRNVITSRYIRTIGQNTLSIYIIHYIILYGTFTGYGLYYYFHHTLPPYVAIIGAIAFVMIVLLLSYWYNQKKDICKQKWHSLLMKIRKGRAYF